MNYPFLWLGFLVTWTILFDRVDTFVYDRKQIAIVLWYWSVVVIRSMTFCFHALTLILDIQSYRNFNARCIWTIPQLVLILEFLTPPVSEIWDNRLKMFGNTNYAYFFIKAIEIYGVYFCNLLSMYFNSNRVEYDTAHSITSNVRIPRFMTHIFMLKLMFKRLN